MTIAWNSIVRKRTKEEYSDAEYLLGLANNNVSIQNTLYKNWRKYFDDNYRSLFFGIDDSKTEIIQNTYLELWNKVRLKRIYVIDGVVIGSNGKPFTAKLMTYMMSIALIQHKEMVRKANEIIYIDDLIKYSDTINSESSSCNAIDYLQVESIENSPFLDNTAEQDMREIVSRIISSMSPRCNQILTSFYYEEKDLDTIMADIQTFESKDALKTSKNKCLSRLKESAKSEYYRYLNS